MFSIIQQLNTRSLDYSKTTKQVSHSSEQMRLTVGGADQRKNRAGQCQQVAESGGAVRSQWGCGLTRPRFSSNKRSSSFIGSGRLNRYPWI